MKFESIDVSVGCAIPEFYERDPVSERISNAFAKRARWLDERINGVGSLLETAGICVVAFSKECRPLSIGSEAARWLNVHAPGVKWEYVTSAWLKEQIPACDLWIGFSELVIWKPGSDRRCGGERSCLTKREREIFGWLQQGKTAPETAAILGCSSRTVEKHIQNLYRKLGVRDRASLILGSSA